MEFRETLGERRKIRGYAAFLVCGLCVALNLIFYLLAATFAEADLTELPVTLALLVVFAISSIVAWVYAIKNRREPGLVALLLLSIAFVILISVSSSFSWDAQSVLQLSYAIIVIALAPFRIVTLRRSPV
jgi:drug/metabolite transporter (DMT)-like permease